MQDPQSLHKYAYVHGDPITGVDPSGQFLAGSGTLAAIGLALGNVAAEGTTGALILGLLEYAAKPAFNLRAAAFMMIANGDHESGFYNYNISSTVIAAVFGFMENIDVAVSVGAVGLTLAVAAIKVAKHFPEIADSLITASRKVLDDADDLGRAIKTRNLNYKLERNSQDLLRVLERDPSISANNAHFFKRHGAQTTMDQQYIRANTGWTPDGAHGPKVDSARFLTHRAQLSALERARAINKATGQKVVNFNMGETIGEGYLRLSNTHARTTNVRAVFRDDGRLVTLFPLLDALP